MSMWTESRVECLRAFCDTVFPSIQGKEDPHGFWARRASDLHVDGALAGLLEARTPAPQLAGLLGLLDALSGAGLSRAPAEQREAILHGFAQSSAEVAAALAGLQRAVLFLCYALPDATGRNPNWPAIDYPGPRAAPPQTPKPIAPLQVTGDLELSADVCVIGSGAGGGVIAGELTARGHQVIVLEAGGYFNEADFNQLELWALQNLHWRGGYQPSADGNVQLLAGAALGGGTLVNWENCVLPPRWVREHWAREHGLTDLEHPSFDTHLQGVLTRLMVNEQCSDYNEPHRRLEAGAQRLGYSLRRAARNVDPQKHDNALAGYHGYGDASGARRSSVNAYLEGACGAGAKILVQTKARRILVENGAAAGVLAECRTADGRVHQVRIKAKHVVSACGALETPALLLRSGIGGPAAGRYLRLHPCVALVGVYPELQHSWWGPPQASMCDQFVRLQDDYGVMIEGAHYTLSAASSIPWNSGHQHKAALADLPRFASFIGFIRDRGHGSVGLDADGESAPVYPLRDDLDLRHLRRALAELANLHEAAGAERILGMNEGPFQSWQRGQSLPEFVQTLAQVPFGAGGRVIFSAHQMGSARMGKDPGTSVARPSGELHDVRNVWIGDTSAFPTSLGVNPMITCMALASRTAAQIVG